MGRSWVVLTAAFWSALRNLPAFVTHLCSSLSLVLYFTCIMAPTKAKGKKSKGETSPVSMTKRAKKTGNKKRVTATTGQDLNLMSDEEIVAPAQTDVGQKLEQLMKMVSDLFS